MPPLFEAVLFDYQRNVPGAREPEVLHVITVFINKIKTSLAGEIERILNAVFVCTLVCCLLFSARSSQFHFAGNDQQGLPRVSRAPHQILSASEGDNRALHAGSHQSAGAAVPTVHGQVRWRM